MTAHLIHVLLDQGKTIQDWEYYAEGLCSMLGKIPEVYASHCAPVIAWLLSQSDLPADFDRAYLFEALKTLSKDTITEKVARKPCSLMAGMNRHIRSRARME
ncbi:hypothetical protein [Ktedonospora formicarum]|uniref:hypothetical protein n=1 Tax=Ktedonospora formicarum TaxID=2778364 RepID=UPI001C691D4E|nr:hypothetical protein [Ktedonospora formicarum]